MKLKFEQSGGFAGLVKGVEVDVKDLPPDEATRLRALVGEGDAAVSETKLSTRGRDLGQYQLEIEDAGGNRTVTYDDSTLPAEAKPLIAYLKKLAKPLD